MTDNEKLLFIEALVWTKRYHDAYPDVGISPSILMLADRISAQTGIWPPDKDLEFIIVSAEMRCKYV